MQYKKKIKKNSNTWHTKYWLIVPFERNSWHERDKQLLLKSKIM